MQQNSKKLDLEFGLSQLNGNTEIYTSLLTRFQDEYQTVADSFVALLNNQDYSELKLQAHTIKGIAGSLGMPALQHQCDKIQKSAQNCALPDEYLIDLTQILNDTLDEIGRYIAKLNPSSSDLSKSNLVSALQNNEFLTEQQLQEYLPVLDLSVEQQSTLLQAVNDLDYPTALQLLEAT